MTLAEHLAQSTPEQVIEALQEYHKATTTGLMRIYHQQTAQHLPMFVANGTTYYVANAEEGISLIRYRELSKMLPQIGFDGSLMDIYGALNKAKGLLDAQQWTGTAVLLHNLMESISSAERNWPLSIRACALFIYAEGEDRAQLPTPEMIEKKARDWNEIHPMDFFFCCLKVATSWNEELAVRQQMMEVRLGLATGS